MNDSSEKDSSEGLRRPWAAQPCTSGRSRAREPWAPTGENRLDVTGPAAL